MGAPATTAYRANVWATGRLTGVQWPRLHRFHRGCRRIVLGVVEGARLVTGDTRTPERPEGGHHVRPTLFADVESALRIAREEDFGPVLIVIPFDDEDGPVRIANDSKYGLAGGVSPGGCPSTASHRHRRRLRGGAKSSGIGREFGATGLAQYIEYKTIAAIAA
ncbi:hypothetical protein GCM10018793_12260 [Streptomyces sulfonofaciens]|uniref:Aldehyde dehydrogenase domain-containing protein n=1 Tax=Streptomyces sulfonofaciens TaxID=68272 RepID=A0A919FW40_9ACTN|nr:hypothetical protein GCM10018793_12260 [Streptomyces sulfonofaciens]